MSYHEHLFNIPLTRDDALGYDGSWCRGLSWCKERRSALRKAHRNNFRVAFRAFLCAVYIMEIKLKGEMLRTQVLSGRVLKHINVYIQSKSVIANLIKYTLK